MLKRAIDFPAISGGTLREQLDFYARRRPTAEASYLTFFMLWMMALEHGRRAADVDINIDLLSTSAEYRRSAAEKLTRGGIEGLDFSDAGHAGVLWRSRFCVFRAARKQAGTCSRNRAIRPQVSMHSTR